MDCRNPEYKDVSRSRILDCGIPYRMTVASLITATDDKLSRL